MQFKASGNLMPRRQRLLLQTLLVMNLTVILVVAACLQVSARGYSQKMITLSEKNAPLETVFKDIRKQTGYTFFCKYEWLQQARKVDIEVKNVPLEEVLNICFKDQPLTYTIIKQTIIVKQKQEQLPADKDLPPSTYINVHGRVLDEAGKPLVAVTVTVKGTKIATSTDENGEFTLNNTDKNATLIFSSVNMVPFEVRVNGRVDLLVNLKAKTSQLDEVQIIAYGTTTERLSTGDVTTVKAADIEKQPVSNPLLALEGRVPGLFIAQTTGFAGSAVSVSIQGQNSIASGNDPLYVIDGVPYTSQLLPTLNGVQGGGLGYSPSPLNFINPTDIESISVLKDADATSIYGSRAANGAILITTKKGKAGQTKFDFNLQNGWGKVTRKLDLLNTRQYLQMRHEAFYNDSIANPSANIQPGPGDYDINGTWDTTRYTDWQKALIGGTAQYTNLSTTISGGNTGTQYLVGGTYHRETNVFPGDFSDLKGSLHFNINNVSSNQKFKLQLTGSYLVDNNKLPNHDLTSDAITLAPNAPALYKTDGSLNWEPDTNGNSTWSNPLSYLNIKGTIKTNNLISNAVISYQLLPGLEIKSSLGYTNLQTNETIIHPVTSVAPENRSSFPRYSLFANSNINSWIIEPQATFKKAIGNGRLEAMVGMTIEQNNSLGQKSTAIGFNSDLLLGDIGSAASVQAHTTAASIYKYNAAFGRLSYNWDDKYLLSLTGRRDGSSRFGAANQFHNFGSIAGAWIFSREDLFLKNLSFISYGKLRASYGTTGNDQISDYQFLSLYSSTYVSTPYQGATGLQPNGLTNPYLQWEETKKSALGLDLGILKDRLLLTANYFINRSSNQLLLYTLPVITGFGSIVRNFPATVQNSGWELILSSTNVKTRDFSWSTHINLTLPRNKLIAFPNISNSYYASAYVVGQPITIQKVFHLVGVNDTTGIYQFADSKGNPTYNPSLGTDNTVIVNTAPKFYGGFQNSFTYKGFQLDVFFQFVKQVAHNYYFGNFPGYFSSSPNSGNQPTTVLGRWQKSGDVRSIQRYNSDLSISNEFVTAWYFSDAAYSDASYIRLKNLSLSWQLPESWRKKAMLQNARLYIQGQNLLTITRYIGIDPETQSSSTLPPLKILTLGIQLTL